MLLNTKSINAIPVLLLLFASSVRLMVPGLNSIILFVVLPCLFIYILRGFNLFSSITIKSYCILFAWFCITTIMSTDMAFSINYMKTLVGGLMVAVIFYALCIKKRNNVYWLLSSYFFLLATTLLYLYNKGTLFMLDIVSERLDDELVNANDLAYYMFYVIISATILIQDLKIKKSISAAIYIALIILALGLASITASRQIIILVIPFCLFSIYYTFLFKKLSFKTIIFLVALGLILFIVAQNFISNSFEGSMLEQRMRGDVKEDTRASVFYEAISVGFNNIIFGVGPGCLAHFSSDGAFSHNSYAECFSCSGLPALLLYVLLLYRLCKKQIRRYRQTKRREFYYLAGSILLWCIYNILYVFYSSLWLIGFVFILDGYSDNLYREITITTKKQT